MTHSLSVWAVCCSGGMLTYLIPTAYDFELTDLPTHPCLDLLQVSGWQLGGWLPY